MAISPGARPHHLGGLGQVRGRAGPVTRADGRVGRGLEQPERVVAEVPGLGRARGAAQRGGRLAGVRRELRGLLVPPLGLAGQAAGEGQLGQRDRQPVRLRPSLGVSRRPAQRGAQLVGQLVERPTARPGRRAAASPRRPRRPGTSPGAGPKPDRLRRPAASWAAPYWRMVSSARYRVPDMSATATRRLCSASRASAAGIGAAARRRPAGAARPPPRPR